MKSEENVVFLNPKEIENGYYIESGWASVGNEIEVPGIDSLWQVKGNKVLKFSISLQRPVRLVKSIFYKNKDDAEALQTYKILCNRNFGKAATLSSPRLEHFGSKEFCFESYLESKNERDAS